MNMMRKNNNRGGGKHRGGRRYNNGGSGGGGGNSRPSEGQNLTRQKHHATQMREKYNNMVRDAQINGDRVDVEYYLQHVDHYNRVLTNIAEIEAERFAHQREAQVSQGGGNDGGAQGGENQGGESGGEAATAEGQQASGGDNTQRQQHRHSRPRYNQPDDNGAREANSNTTDIPLPGNILPPI